MTTTVTDSDILAPPSIVSGVILAVDPANYSCTVAFASNHTRSNVSWLSSAQHLNRGSGINVMPQPGDSCWGCFPADGSIPFILGFITRDGDDRPVESGEKGDASYKGSRPNLKPGDIHLGTDDGNFVILRRGGMVQIGSSQVSQTVYVPIEGLIRSYFMKYHGFSPLGEVVWDHATIDQSTATTEATDIPVLLKFSCRDTLQDKQSSIEIRMGRLTEEMLDTSVDTNLLQEGKKTSVEFLGEKAEVETTSLDQGDGDKEHMAGAAQASDGIGYSKYTSGSPSGLFSMVLNPNGSGIKFSLQLDKSGAMFLRTESHLHVEAGDTAFLSAENRVRLETGKESSVDLSEDLKLAVQAYIIEILKEGVININGNSVNLNASTGDVEVSAAKSIVMKANSSISLQAPTIKIGLNPVHDVLVGASLWKTALANHQHQVSAVGAPTVSIPAPASTVLPAAARTSTETISKITMG